MSYTPIINTYHALNIDEEFIEKSTVHLKRKAVKKLREIENLKQNLNPTAEEREKIATEKYWANIIHPKDDPPHKPTAKELKKQADKEKRRKREEEKNEKKALEAAKEQEERIKREQARRKAQEEAREKARLLFESQREVREIERVLSPFHEIPEAVMIYREYMSISAVETHKTAFRKLSLKYHPDKNPTKNTTFCQQILHHIYVNIVKK